MFSASSSTETNIASMTDAGEFERLATSILRVADPLYKGLIHTGVNSLGQTIADPLDGISICVQQPGNVYAVAAEHTITAKDKLRNKWLCESNGDLIKAISKLNSFRDKNPAHKLRVILTSKFTPSSDLVSEANLLAEQHSIELDIWSNDRLAGELDLSSEGQAIRLKFFGTSQSRMSFSLAREISKQQLSRYAPPDPTCLLLARDLGAACPTLESSRSPIVFLTGTSGAGKSAFCHQLCGALLAEGGLAFVVSHETLESCNGAARALAQSIIAEAPSLVFDDPISELLRLSQGKEIMIWIEDVNLSASPTDLIIKIDRFSDEIRSKDPQHKLKMICPVWPENLRRLPGQVGKNIQDHVVDLAPFTNEEAASAIKLRHISASEEITKFEADKVRESLGNDPLLIGLWSGQIQENESSVFATYLDTCLFEFSSASFRSVFSLRRSILDIAEWMLEHRSHDPFFNDLAIDLGNNSVFADLEAMCSVGGLFKEVVRKGQSKLGFRHDRVRDFLLVEAISRILNNNEFSRSFLTDPHYTDLVARAALEADVNADFWEMAESNAPVLIFCALKHAQKQNLPIVDVLTKVCEGLVDAGLLEKVSEPVRREIEWQIAGLVGVSFEKLISATRPDFHAGREARILNGDVMAAANLCYSHDPGCHSPYRDRVVAHAKERYGKSWINRLAELITDAEASDEQREAALYLAGECSDARLVDGIVACWHRMKERKKKLSHGILFAAVSCASGNNEDFLEEVFDAWQALPTKDPAGADKSGLSNERYYIAHDCLAGGLRRIKSCRTISPLIQVAKSHEDMASVIYGCLESIDHPLAASYVASFIASVDKRIEGVENRFNFAASSRLSFYGSDSVRYVKYTKQSMNELKGVWSDVDTDPIIRRRFFHLWRTSIGSKELRELADKPPKDLEDDALSARCQFGDVTAIPELKAKIKGDSERRGHWFNLIRHFDSHAFEDLILAELDARSAANLKGERVDRSADFVIPDILAERRDKFAERTILDHWDHLKDCRQYPHLLLCIATPKTLKLHASYYERIENKSEYFKLLDHAYGIKDHGRSGITELKQLEALEPYLDEFDSYLVEVIWEECNTKGFENWRRLHLDGKLSKDRWAHKQVDEHAAFADIDATLQRDRGPESAAWIWARVNERRSLSTRMLIERAVRYADTRASNIGAEFLAEVVALIGFRSDLALLSKHVDAGLLSRKHLNGTTFAVQKRTLV